MMEPVTPADTDILEQAEPSPAADQKLHLILIDGSGFIFRAYHALPPMTRPDGTPVNAVFGFSNMLAKLLRERRRQSRRRSVCCRSIARTRAPGGR
jgi:DNA polymerase I